MPSTARGRPRDSTIDARTLDATRALLLEEGLAATTVQAVAERAGVHTSAIYRRWPTRLDLIEDAAFADLPPGRIEPTGDLARDLRRFVRAYVKTFDQPVVRVTIPALLAGYLGDNAPQSRKTLARLTVRPQLRAILTAAPPGLVDPTIDPDDIFDLLLGSVLVRVLVPPEVRRRPPIERIVETLLRVLTCASTPDRSARA